MIEREHPELSVRSQCELLRVSRSGLYYEPEPTSHEQLALMRRIDELHLKYPFSKPGTALDDLLPYEWSLSQAGLQPKL